MLIPTTPIFEPEGCNVKKGCNIINGCNVTKAAMSQKTVMSQKTLILQKAVIWPRPNQQEQRDEPRTKRRRWMNEAQWV